MKKTKLPYEEFANEKCQALTKLQESFREFYEIEKYDNWYYTQASEILRLYSGNEEIYFKYIPVGTFSNATNSWLWAWSNKNSVEPRKERTLQVRTFGKQEGYQQLISDHFEGDEYTGWELTSIAFDVLGGIGTYRVISDHLEKYLIITSVITKEEAKSIEKSLIECETHGVMRAAFICQHLNSKERLGFEESFETYKGMELSEEDSLSAWCDSCEKERIKTNGWNDVSMEFANIRVVCEGCYFDLKKFNTNEKETNISS